MPLIKLPVRYDPASHTSFITLGHTEKELCAYCFAAPAMVGSTRCLRHTRESNKRAAINRGARVVMATDQYSVEGRPPAARVRKVGC
jgi:hypothetical protein